jgi:peptidoglycan hydrolase CwlO-like protein
MSDFYEGRMIPLKIADMAIINCNKEIEKLQIENDRLKSLTAEMDKTINMSQAGCRQLKAEVERLEAVIESHKDAGLRVLAMLDEERRLTKHLKAEVERLTAFTTRTIIPNELLQAEVERLQNNCDYLDQKLDEEIDKSAMLCGQVMRLTDAITSGNAITPDAHPQP